MLPRLGLRHNNVTVLHLQPSCFGCFFQRSHQILIPVPACGLFVACAACCGCCGVRRARVAFSCPIGIKVIIFIIISVGFRLLATILLRLLHSLPGMLQGTLDLWGVFVFVCMS
jgi:hypothetical protein